jgi:hypothetical protein
MKSEHLKNVYLESFDLTNRKFKSTKLTSVSLVRCQINSYLLDRCESSCMEVLDIRYSTSPNFNALVSTISRLYRLKQLYLCIEML